MKTNVVRIAKCILTIQAVFLPRESNGSCFTFMENREVSNITTL